MNGLLMTEQSVNGFANAKQLTSQMDELFENAGIHDPLASDVTGKIHHRQPTAG